MLCFNTTMMTLKTFIDNLQSDLNIKFDVVYPKEICPISLFRDYSHCLILKHERKIFNIPVLINNSYFIINRVKRALAKRLEVDFDKVFKFLEENNVFEDFNEELKSKIRSFILKNKKFQDFDIKKLEEIKEKVSLRDLTFYKVKKIDYYSFLLNYFLKKSNNKNEKNNPESFLKKIPTDFAIKLIEKNPSLFPFVDLTNPLSNIEDQRKIIFMGNEFSPRKKRDIHDTHKFKLCPIQTPESEKIGIILHLAKDAYIKDNQLEHSNESQESLFSYAALQIPYLQHNDSSRALMASKNLKQAIPLNDSEPPFIKTGYEKEIVSLDKKDFYLKSLYDGEIKEVLEDRIIIRSGKSDYEIDLGIYLFNNTKVARRYLPLVEKGQKIKKGDIIAELLGIKNGELCLGKNLVTFYMSYFGYNMDDAIVISRSAAQKLSHYHIEEFEFTYKKSLTFLAKRNLKIDKENIPILIIDDKKIHSTKEMVGGTILDVKFNESEKKVFLYLSYIKPASVGDKLMGRYGNKGVISLILDDEKMPYTQINGKLIRAEIILNPHGIISRMNLGQLFETHWSWIAINHPDQKIKEKAVFSGKPFNKTDFEELKQYLKETGLDEKGQIKVTVPPLNERQNEFVTENPITIGYQYFVKLNHLAEKKIHCRSNDGPYSLITGIPLKGKSLNGGQRFGEMETWAFLAQDEIGNLLKLFSNLGLKDNVIKQPLRALYTYLIGTGCVLEFLDGDKKVIPLDEINIGKPVYLRVRKVDNKYIEINLEAKQVEKLSDIWDDTEKLDKDLDTFKYIKTNDDNYIPVIPIRYRPFELSDINKLYFEIFKKSKQGSSKELEKKLEEKFSKKINGKNGLIRAAFLGRRLDFSGRAVIVPNPQLDIDVIKVPSLFKKKWNLNKHDIVCLNRQPTLHIHNLQSFRVQFTTNNVIEINPLICSGFGADFDGDTMAVYFIPEKYKDLFNWKNFYVDKHIYLIANGNLNLSFSQDIISGLFYKFKFENNHPLDLEERLKNIFEKIKGTKNLNAKDINSLIRDYLLENKIPSNEALKILKDIALLGLEGCTESGLSFSLFDLLEIKEKTNDKELANVLSEFLETNVFNSPAIMVKSGARGNEGQLKQIILKRGEIKTISNHYQKEVNRSYLDLLSPDEYFDCCYGARSGLGDKKLLTPVCGYLTRKLIFMVNDLCIIEEDCGVDIGFDIKINKGGKFDVNNFLGRFLINFKEYNLDTPFLTIGNLRKIKSLNSGVLKIRSPLKCKSLEKGGICSYCYGLLLNTMTIPKVGTNVGIISAQSIGERATQDAMKTFHSGTQTKVVSSIEDIITLLTTPHKSELIKNNKHNYKDTTELRWFLANELFELYERKVSLIHYEIISLRVIQDDLSSGGIKFIEKKDFFSKFAFSAPFYRLKAICDKKDEEIQDSIYKSLILG